MASHSSASGCGGEGKEKAPRPITHPVLNAPGNHFLQRHVLLEGGTDPLDLLPPEDASAKGNERRSGGGGGGGSGGGRFGAVAGQSGVGVYVCALGGLPLFLSEDELRLPGTAEGANGAWPGFPRPIHPDHVVSKGVVLHGLLSRPPARTFLLFRWVPVSVLLYVSSFLLHD